MLNNTVQADAPRAEALIHAAHRCSVRLREGREALVRSGIADDDLPDEVSLMAFALLGDHDRVMLVEQLVPHWSALQSKGLAQGAIEEAVTPDLRLLAHALPHTDAIEDIWHRLGNIALAPAPPREILRCATRVSGCWGQQARLHVSAQDVFFLQIIPDPIFGLQPTLLAARTNGRCAGSFEFPIDEGAITLTLLTRSGEVFRHVVHSKIAEVV
jgi:hypothetical protein